MSLHRDDSIRRQRKDDLRFKTSSSRAANDRKDVRHHLLGMEFLLKMIPHSVRERSLRRKLSSKVNKSASKAMNTVGKVGLIVTIDLLLDRDATRGVHYGLLPQDTTPITAINFIPFGEAKKKTKWRLETFSLFFPTKTFFFLLKVGTLFIIQVLSI